MNLIELYKSDLDEFILSLISNYYNLSKLSNLNVI